MINERWTVVSTIWCDWCGVELGTALAHGSVPRIARENARDALQRLDTTTAVWIASIRAHLTVCHVCARTYRSGAPIDHAGQGTQPWDPATDEGPDA
jgi:hypothetical protein